MRRAAQLVEWRERVAREKRAAFRDQVYWEPAGPRLWRLRAAGVRARPGPGGPWRQPHRRIFTGDRSGDWLFASMHRTGFANQPESIDRDDGLKLHSAWISAVRCAPPANKPLPSERDNCLPCMAEELGLLPGIRVIVCLGAFAWEAACRLYGIKPRPRFGHGAEHEPAGGGPVLAASEPARTRSRASSQSR